MSTTRIYIVTPVKPLTIEKEHQKARLVRAVSAGQAVRHATANLYDVDVANTEEVADLCGGGTKVEDAKEGE